MATDKLRSAPFHLGLKSHLLCYIEYDFYKGLKTVQWQMN